MGIYTTFFSSLPSTIRTLQMTNYLFSRDLFAISFSFIDLIPSTLPIEYLILRYCQAGFLIEVPEKLSSVEHNGTSTKFFPRLKRLTLLGSPRRSVPCCASLLRHWRKRMKSGRTWIMKFLGGLQQPKSYYSCLGQAASDECSSLFSDISDRDGSKVY